MTSAIEPPPGYRIHSFATLDSTNDEALRRLAAGDGTAARPGDVIAAECQTAGRGRRRRRWHSPPGNLYATIIAAPGTAEPATVGELAFVAALGCGEALAEIVPDRVQLRYKWPNDVLLNGAKAAGILIESGPPRAVGPAAGCMVVGIGINLVSAPGEGPFPATSLAAEGIAGIDPGTLLVSLCHRFDHWLRRWQAEGFAPVRAAWLARACGIGEPIEARLATEVARGTFAGIDERGALVLDCQDGRRRVISAGDVFFRAA